MEYEIKCLERNCPSFGNLRACYTDPNSCIIYQKRILLKEHNPKYLSIKDLEDISHETKRAGLQGSI